MLLFANFIFAMLVLYSTPIFAEGERPAPMLPTAINSNLNKLNERSDLILQSLNDNSLRFGNLKPIVRLFETQLLENGMPQKEVDKKKKSLAIQVETAVTTAATLKLTMEARTQFVAPAGGFTVGDSFWMDAYKPASRAVLYGKARFPALDLSKIAVVLKRAVKKQDPLDLMVHQFANEEHFIWVNCSFVFAEHALSAKVKVPVLNLASVQALFLQQVFGSSQVILVSDRFLFSTLSPIERLQHEATFVYSLAKINQRQNKLFASEGYPLAEAQAKQAFKDASREHVRTKDWNTRTLLAQNSISALIKFFRGDPEINDRTWNRVFLEIFEDQFQQVVREDEIQAYTEMVQFLRGLRINRDEILSILASQIRLPSKYSGGLQEEAFEVSFPTLREDFNVAIVDG